LITNAILNAGTENIEEKEQAGDDRKELTVCTPVVLANKKNEHTDTSAKETNAVLNADEIEENRTENMVVLR
jgi:hypothetical protein